jgi:cell wall-associated NlpC family hydrolase
MSNSFLTISQCCVNIKCNAPAGAGYCRSVQDNGCPSGDFHPGYCPGDDDIQCCVKSSSPPPPVGGNLGQKILAQAEQAKGIPYVWGGGSCSGPTGSPRRGFDCSGLLSWAICRVTGRNLFAEGLRVTYTMYCASESTLKYQ